VAKRMSTTLGSWGLVGPDMEDERHGVGLHEIARAPTPGRDQRRPHVPPPPPMIRCEEDRGLPACRSLRGFAMWMRLA